MRASETPPLGPSARPADYEPPAIEVVLDPDGLDREVQFAGPATAPQKF